MKEHIKIHAAKQRAASLGADAALSGGCAELSDEGMGSFHKAQGQLCLAASIYLTPCLSVSLTC